MPNTESACPRCGGFVWRYLPGLPRRCAWHPPCGEKRLADRPALKQVRPG